MNKKAQESTGLSTVVKIIIVLVFLLIVIGLIYFWSPNFSKAIEALFG